MLQHKEHHSISELCDEFGVTARALRFYEDGALIAAERRGTQRLKTVEICQARLDKLKQQEVDIEAAIKELEDFIELVKAQNEQEK